MATYETRERDVKDVRIEMQEPGPGISPVDVVHIIGMQRNLGRAVAVLAVSILALTAAVIAGFTTRGDKYDASTQQTVPQQTGTSTLMTITSSAAAPANFPYNTTALFAGSGEWVKKKDMPEALSDHAAIGIPHEVDGFLKVLVIGGMDTSGKASDRVYEYDPLLHTWKAVALMPEPRLRHAVAYVDGQVWVIGGVPSNSDTASNKTFVYDLKTATWGEGPQTLVKHVDACAVTAGGRVVVIGGYDSEADYNALNVVEALEPSKTGLPKNGNWKRLASMPTARGDVACVADGNNVTVLGGWLEDWSQPRTTVEVFQADKNVWAKGRAMDLPRGDFGAGLLSRGRILVVAGEYSMRGRSQVPRHETTMFAPEHSMWIRLAPIPTARFRFPTVVVDGVLFAFGGSEVCTTSYATGETDCPANALASVEAFMETPHPKQLFVHYARPI